VEIGRKAGRQLERLRDKVGAGTATHA